MLRLPYAPSACLHVGSRGFRPKHGKGVRLLNGRPTSPFSDTQGTRIQSAMSKSSQFVQSITKSPFLWGILGSVGFYALVHAIPGKTPGMPFVQRTSPTIRWSTWRR